MFVYIFIYPQYNSLYTLFVISLFDNMLIITKYKTIDTDPVLSIVALESGAVMFYSDRTINGLLTRSIKKE